MRCFDFPEIENGIIEDKSRSYYYQETFLVFEDPYNEFSRHFINCFVHFQINARTTELLKEMLISIFVVREVFLSHCTDYMFARFLHVASV